MGVSVPVFPWALPMEGLVSFWLCGLGAEKGDEVSMGMEMRSAFEIICVDDSPPGAVASMVVCVFVRERVRMRCLCVWSGDTYHVVPCVYNGPSRFADGAVHPPGGCRESGGDPAQGQ